MAKASLHQLAQAKKKGGGTQRGAAPAPAAQPQAANTDPGRYQGPPGAGGAEGDPASMSPKQRRQAAHKAQVQAGQDMQSRMDPSDPRRYMNPRKLYKRSMGRSADSEYAPYSRMRNVEDARSQLGFGEPQEQLTKHYEEDLAAGAPVDYQEPKRETEEWRPQMNQLQEYAMEHLGQGLTPDEENAIRGRMRDALAASQQQAQSEASSQMAASGLEGSGIAGARALQLQRAQQQGTADIEREITTQNLARKGELEQLASQTGQLSLGEGRLSEAGREYDVSAEQARQRAVEAGMGDITGLESGQFEDLLNYAENARQAKASREASRRAARLAQPSGLETAGTIVGSIL